MIMEEIVNPEKGLLELKKDVESIKKALDEIKQATFAGEYKFEQEMFGLVTWIDEDLSHQERSKMQVVIQEWDRETMAYFLGEKGRKFIEECSQGLEFVMEQTEGLCLFDTQKISEQVLFEGNDVSMQIAELAAHWLNNRIVLTMWDNIDEIFTY